MIPPTFTIPVAVGRDESLSLVKLPHDSVFYLRAEGLFAWDGFTQDDPPPQQMRLHPTAARRLAHALLYAADLMDANDMRGLAPTIEGR